MLHQVGPLGGPTPASVARMAKLIACRVCLSQISTEARSCPRCGALALVKRSNVGLVVGLSVGGAVVVIIAAAAAGANERANERADRAVRASPSPRPSPPSQPVTTPKESEPPAPPASAPPAAPPLSVSAEQLRKGYEENEVSADERYRDKVLDVTGFVKAVRKDPFDQPYVELSTNNMFESVHARFASGHDDVLSNFLRGDKVILRCIGNNVVIGSPKLKECVLQHQYRRSSE